MVGVLLVSAASTWETAGVEVMLLNRLGLYCSRLVLEVRLLLTVRASVRLSRIPESRRLVSGPAYELSVLCSEVVRLAVRTALASSIVFVRVRVGILVMLICGWGQKNKAGRDIRKASSLVDGHGL